MKKDYIWISALIIGVIMGTIVFSRINPYMIAVFPAAAFIGILYLYYKELAIATSIIVLPLLTSIVFNREILPVPGGKFNNVLMMILLIGFLLNNKLKFSDVKLGTFFYFTRIFERNSIRNTITNPIIIKTIAGIIRLSRPVII